MKDYKPTAEEKVKEEAEKLNKEEIKINSKGLPQVNIELSNGKVIDWNMLTRAERVRLKKSAPKTYAKIRYIAMTINKKYEEAKKEGRI